jgi:hypothetical protein
MCGGAGFQEELDRWIIAGQTRTDGDLHEDSRRPFLIERGGRRLRVRFVSCSWGDQLLFDERVTAYPGPDPALGLTPREIDVLTVSGAGTVSSTPAGIDCPTDRTQNYAGGSSVSLIPSPGTFVEWSDACIGTGTCIVPMNAVKSIIATFS